MEALPVIESFHSYLYVVRPDDVAEKRFVEIGPEVGNNTIVERGLAAGEQIVIEGLHKLSHGMKVEIQPIPSSNENAAEEESINEE